MGAAVSIPEKLYREARERGIDVESLLVDALLRELRLDPEERELRYAWSWPPSC